MVVPDEPELRRALSLIGLSGVQYGNTYEFVRPKPTLPGLLIAWFFCLNWPMFDSTIKEKSKCFRKLKSLRSDQVKFGLVEPSITLSALVNLKSPFISWSLKSPGTALYFLASAASAVCHTPCML